MTRRMLTAWDFHPSVILGCLVLIGLYLAVTRLRPTPRFGWYLLGVVAILLALISPLDILSDDYLFSAHMIQHLLLVFIAPPLLLLGLPREEVRHFLERPLPRWLERRLGQPLVAWLLGVGTLWLWHLPSWYAATLEWEGVHITEHLTFLVTGVIFWWPLMGPGASHALNTFYALIYLFLAGLANSLLGILLTFAPVLIYQGYVAPADPLGILPLLRQKWGLSPRADQQLGGLFMWVGGMCIFLVALMAVLIRWYAPDSAERSSGALNKSGRKP